MFIKLSFHEEIITVPNVWAGMVVSLRTEPKLIRHLPKDITANQMVNRQAHHTKADSANYDYYFKCDHHDAQLATRTIALLITHYKTTYEEQHHSLSTINTAFFQAGELYPQHNQIIIALEQMQKQAHEEGHTRDISLSRLSVMQNVRLDYQEEEPACCFLI